MSKRLLGKRTPKQCRERWSNHLNPELKKTPWTSEEDERLIACQAELGNTWTRIAAHLPGRSENEVKNRWYGHLNRKMMQRPDITRKRLRENFSPEDLPGSSLQPQKRSLSVLTSPPTVASYHHRAPPTPSPTPYPGAALNDPSTVDEQESPPNFKWTHILRDERLLSKLGELYLSDGSMDLDTSCSSTGNEPIEHFNYPDLCYTSNCSHLTTSVSTTNSFLSKPNSENDLEHLSLPHHEHATLPPLVIPPRSTANLGRSTTLSTAQANAFPPLVFPPAFGWNSLSASPSSSFLADLLSRTTSPTWLELSAPPTPTRLTAQHLSNQYEQT